jgi:diacylglycerol kinase family enzyme
VQLTEGPGHARELALAAVAEGFELVLAVGGDGTANETAWGLLGSGVAMGVIPVGSGNGLARTLNVPLRPERALRALASGVVRPMDVGFANERPFLNVSGAGLDALIGDDFHAHGQGGGRRGIFTYVRLSLARAFSYAAERWLLEAGGLRLEGAALVVAVLNGRQWGGGATIAPRARLDDGELDVIFFADAPRLGLIATAPRLFLGGVERAAGYRHVRAPTATLTGPAAFLHHRDGEPEPAVARVAFRVEPKALRILVPAATAADPEGPFTPE